jgi:hypothetical protein
LYKLVKIKYLLTVFNLNSARIAQVAIVIIVTIACCVVVVIPVVSALAVVAACRVVGRLAVGIRDIENRVAGRHSVLEF